MGDEVYLQYELIEAEQKIFSGLKSYKTEHIPIQTDFGNDDKIWTLSMNTQSPNTPIVMLHGFAAGIAFWRLNLEPLSKNRPLYAIDILGFGRSSRPKFSRDNVEAEEQMVQSIEAWRKQMNLEKFILLGHSMGANLSLLYGMSYPERVEHLILVDEWGLTDKFDSPSFFVKLVCAFISGLDPLEIIRYLGSYWGTLFIQKTRGDIFGKIGAELNDYTVLPRYFYNCIASQHRESEKAFYNMTLGFGWPKRPIIKRIHKLNKDIAITFLYGSRSWMDSEMGTRVKESRPNSFVDIHIVDDAGHHIYSEQADVFNEIVTKTCDFVDRRKRVSPLEKS